MRKYKVMARDGGVKGDVIGEYTGEDGAGRSVLWMPDSTHPSISIDAAEALDRAYQAGRCDREAELIPGDGPDDEIRIAVRDLALRVLRQDGSHEWVFPRGSSVSYVTEFLALDQDAGTIDVLVGNHVKRYKMTLLLEEL